MEYKDELKLVVKAEVDRAIKDLNLYNKTTKQAEVSTAAFAKAASLARRGLAAAGFGVSLAFISSELNTFAKKASEAEETASKFAVVFRDIQDQAEQVAAGYAQSFNVATSTAQKLLGDVGDLLTGMGATQEQALELAESVTSFGSDLASFTNYAGGASGAVSALTKMMLGEREMVKSLGIVIREADVQQRLLEKGQKDLTGQAKLLATAQASLELAMEQSKNAIGDYTRTADSTANVTRRLSESYKEMQENAGVFVNRILTPLKSGLADVIDYMNDLAEKNRGLTEIPEKDPRLVQIERNNHRIEQLRREADENIATLKTGYKELEEIATKPVVEAENWWEGYTLETKLNEAQRALEDFYQKFTGNSVKISIDSESDIQQQLQTISRWMDDFNVNNGLQEQIDALVEENERLQRSLEGTSEASEDASQKMLNDWDEVKKAIFSDQSITDFSKTPISLPPIYSDNEVLQAELNALEDAINSVWESQGEFSSLDTWQEDLDLLVSRYDQIKGQIESIAEGKEREKRIEELKASLLTDAEKKEQQRLRLYTELNGYLEKGLLTLQEVDALMASFDGQDLFASITATLEQDLAAVERTSQAYAGLASKGQRVEEIYDAAAEKSLLVSQAFEQLASSTEISAEELQHFIDVYGKWLKKSEEPPVTGFEALKQQFKDFTWEDFTTNLEEQLSENLIGALGEVFGSVGEMIGSGEFDGKGLSQSVISNAASMMAAAVGPYAPLVQLAGGILGGLSSAIFDTIDQVKEVNEALKEANDNLHDLFLDVLDMEKELADQRMEAIEDEMDLLEQNKDLRLEILRDQWKSGQITGSEYFAQATQINEEYSSQQDALENQQTMITGVEDIISTLSEELDGLSGWTKFWTHTDEDLEEQITTYQDLLKEISEDPDGLSDEEIRTLAAKYKIEVPAAATGADFITSGPQLLLVGDNSGGKERVQVTPISSPNTHGPSSGGDVHITIEGDVYGIDDLYMKLDTAGKRLMRLGRVSA